MIFVVDTSGSIKKSNPLNWNIMLSFMKQIVSVVDIGKNQVAIVSYSEKVTLVRSFTATQTREAVIK